MGEGPASSHVARLLLVAGYLARRDCITSSDQIAEAFGISQRTVYRDVQDLRSIGLEIEGEAGVGFSLSRRVAMSWMEKMMFRNPHSVIRSSTLNIFEQRSAAQEAAFR